MASRWTRPPSPEQQRLHALQRYQLSYSARERAFDVLASGLARLYRAPFALVGFMDAQQQHVKGASGLDLRSLPLRSSFCQHLLTSDDALILGDTTQDQRVMNQPFVTGSPHIRFYAGAPVRSADGFPIGSVCVLDTVSRESQTFDVRPLRHVAHLAEALLEHRQKGNPGTLTFQTYTDRLAQDAAESQG
ncbi:GAF domain-containing protein [Deinococcus oregonensis]|uniref:GAF domain-containing protein n=1 Tax=Deinococcus oregonensis TaxID=1805970 RepID=A0ABV6AVE3_9DEIO